MTSNQVNSFVGNLVEMAKAYEELPNVQHALAEAERLAAQQAETIASREERIMALKAEADAHLARIRELEVERDNAELRFLEADEKASQALEVVARVQGLSEQVASILSPPKAPELKAIDNPMYGDPMAEAPLHPAPQGQRAWDPTTYPAPATPTDTAPPSNAQPSDAGNTEAPHSPSEVAQPDPINASTHAEPTGPSVSPTASEPAPSSEPGPFTGRLYFQVPRYVSLADWLAGGGTEADYNFRP